MRLDPAVAAVRGAVRRCLDDEARVVAVACSGGADSLALMAATVFEGHRADLHVVGVTVDHGLQDGSADHAGRVVAQMSALGADETVSVRVSVHAGGQGPEAAAREARYAVLGEVSQRLGGAEVLLGHTLDDQAETVLLGLARGSGPRSLSGMRSGFDCFRRPLLEVTRLQTEAACRAVGVDVWSDPHNDDPRFTRSRVRHTVLPMLEAELGPGVAGALVRTADLLRADTAALDRIAEGCWRAARVAEDAPQEGLRVSALEDLDEAVLLRVLRLAALAAGAIPSELTHGHVLAVSRLVHGRGAIRRRELQLPGHLTAVREGDLVRFRPTAVSG